MRKGVDLVNFLLTVDSENPRLCSRSARARKPSFSYGNFACKQVIKTNKIRTVEQVKT